MYSFFSAPWYDVKFYPYTPAGVDPVFAVVGDRDVCPPLLFLSVYNLILSRPSYVAVSLKRIKPSKSFVGLKMTTR